jgi:hypothetical protein
MSANPFDDRCPHCGAWGHTTKEDCEVFPAEEGPDIDLPVNDRLVCPNCGDFGYDVVCGPHPDSGEYAVNCSECGAQYFVTSIEPD